MKGAGYVQKGTNIMAFAPDTEDDPQVAAITYNIINGKFVFAIASLARVKKEEVMAWMKARYTYKGTETDDSEIADIHNFLSRDKKTDITVYFMNMKENELLLSAKPNGVHAKIRADFICRNQPFLVIL